MEKPITTEYQLAIFPENYKLEKVGKIAANLLRLDFFDPSSVSINPFDMSVPGEIERLSIFSKDESLKLSISPKKVALYWINTQFKPGFDFKTSKNLDLITQISKSIEIDKLTINRVGFITNLVKEEPNPNNTIKQELLKNRLTEELTAAQLKLTYRTELSIHNKCNKHITISSGYINDNPDKKVVSIQFDLNTYQEDKLSWTIENVKEFTSQAEAKSHPDQIYSELFNNHAETT